MYWSEALEPRRLLTTYYVATTGANSNSGTDISHPFATIQQALNLAVNAGDVVQVAGGIYRQLGTTFTKSGAAGNPITLQAAPGATVIVNGAQLLSGWTSDGSSQPVYVISRSSSYYFGSWGTSQGDAESEPQNQLFIDGQYIPEVISRSVMTPGTFFFDKTNQKLYLWALDGSNPGNHSVEATATGSALLTTNGYSNLVINGLQFEYDANGPQQSAMVQVLNGSSNVLVENVTAQYAAGSDISVAGTNNELLDSHFNYAGQEGFNSGGAVGLKIIDCESAFNDTLAGKGYNQGWEAGADKIADSTGTLVDGLVSHDNYGDGLWFDINNQNAIIRNCVIYNNRDCGIQYEISYTASIYNNLIYNTHFQSNDLYAPDGYGIYLSSSADCQVYDNTVVGSESNGLSSTGGLRSDGYGDYVWSFGNQIENNIIANNETVDDYSDINVDQTSQSVENPSNKLMRVTWSSSLSDYNLYYSSNSGGSNFGPGSESYSQWQQTSGLDSHSVFANPAFANSAVNQYQLPASSPYRTMGSSSGLVGVNYTTLPVVLTADSPVWSSSNALTFNVSFSEPVTGVTPAAFQLVSTQSAAGVITGVSASSGSSFVVSVGSVTGSVGSLLLDLVATNGIQDQAGQVKTPLPYSGGVAANVAAPAAPTVVSIVPFVTETINSGSRSTGNSMAYEVTFNEPVNGVSLNNFHLAATGTVSASLLLAQGEVGSQYLPNGAETYWITAGPTTTGYGGGITGQGTLRLDFVDSGGNVTDSAGRSAAGFSNGVPAQINTNSPTVVSDTPSVTTLTTNTSLAYTVVFNEPIYNVGPSNFSLTTTGTASGTISPTSYSYSSDLKTYTINVTGITGNGTLRLDFSNPNIAQDIAANLAQSYSSGVVAKVNVTADSSTPAVATAAKVSPSPVTSNSASVSVLGQDTVGAVNAENTLTYTWSATGPGSTTFSTNGSNAAKNATATFSKAGSYTLTATITNLEGKSTTSAVSVTVNASVLSSIRITPAPVALVMANSAGSAQFTATGYDQFGNVFANPGTITWSASGGGSINSSGLYTPGSNTGVPLVTATAGGASGSTAVQQGIFTADADINSPSPAGSSKYTAATDTYTLSGSGSDIWNAADQFHFLSQSFNGDGTLIAQVTSLTDPNPWAKAGVMFRDSSAPGAAEASVVMSAENGVGFQWRSSNGGSTSSSDVLTVAFPTWVKLVRSGNSFSAYYSTTSGTPGITDWQPIAAPQTVTMSTNALAGLAVTSHNNGALATATFNSVQLTGADDANHSPVITTATAPVSSGATANLSALAADDLGAGNLTYTWSTVGTPPGPVTFSSNGTGASNNSTASFTTSGTYSFMVTVSDGTNSVNSSTALTVNANVPPAWLTTTGPGTVTWTASTHILSVSGTATVNITADPGSDEPIIQASGSNAQVIITPTTSPSLIHLGGIQLTGGAQLIMTQADAPSAADLNNGEYVGSTHHGNHNVLVLGTTTESANPPFTIDTTSKFDLQDNDLIYHTASSDTTVAPATVGNSNATGGYDNLLAIQALVATGRNGGAWNHNGWQGNGLTSSVAALQNTSDQQESVQLAPVLNNDLPVAYSSWNVGSTSESVGRNDILVKYTYTGDFNLDGKVSGADYNQVLQLNYDNGATPGNEWAFGDTNGDGLLNGADFNTFSLDFNNGTVQGNDPTLL